jgi:predicted nucleic acid-binding protein
MLVLDTNVVLDLLHFDDPVARPIRHALEAGRVRCVASEATLEEWRRVLAYPEFGLDPTRQAELFARYRALAETAGFGDASTGLPHKGTPIHDGLEPVLSGIPRCSDPDDQKFLELAAGGRAQALVSKDRALLKLRRRCASRFRIMTPAEAVRWVDALPT